MATEQEILDAGHEIAPFDPAQRTPGRRARAIGGHHVYLTDAEETARDSEEAIVDAAMAAYVANHKYKDDRRAKYDDIGDQLDNITKVFKFLKATGTDIGSDGDAQIEMSDAVKAAYPKPG